MTPRTSQASRKTERNYNRRQADGGNRRWTRCWPIRSFKLMMTVDASRPDEVETLLRDEGAPG